MTTNPDVRLRFRVLKTRGGWAGFVTGPEGLRRCYLPEASEDALRARVAADHPEARENARLEPALAAQLRDYLRGRPVEFDVTIDWEGSGLTGFQRRVYAELLKAGKETLVELFLDPSGGHGLGGHVISPPEIAFHPDEDGLHGAPLRISRVFPAAASP